MGSTWRLHRSKSAPDRLRVRGFARALAIGGASLTLLFASLVANPARGEEGFAVGSGRASAKLLKVGPSRGALTLAPSLGVALSDFLVTRGRGDVRTADFAALEDSLPPELVSALPTVKVESGEENSEAGRSANVAAVPAPAKTEGVALQAKAGKAPFGASSFTATSTDLGVGTLKGGRSEVWSGVVDGKTREAVATVQIAGLELADGAILLEDLRWHAVQRTGAQETNEATFSVGGATVAGQKLGAGGDTVPTDALAAAVAPILGPLGLQLTFPEPKSEAGAVSLTPLRLRVSASALAPSLVPVTDAIQPGREAVVGSIKDQTDEADAALLLGDIALGVIAGGSTLDIDIGGVLATTAPPAEGFAFGSAGGFKLGVDGTGASLGSAGGSSLGSAGTEGLGAADGGAPSSDAPASGGSDTDGDGREIAAAVPAASVGERGGPMLAVGLIGLMIAALTAAADYRKLRIGRRIIPG